MSGASKFVKSHACAIVLSMLTRRVKPRIRVPERGEESTICTYTICFIAALGSYHFSLHNSSAVYAD
jgi:hypothetical protein